MPQLPALLHRARALLLDFDGPICSVFHALDPRLVTHQLADAVDAAGAAMPGEAGRGTTAPGEADPGEEVPAAMRDAGPHDLLAWVIRERPGSAAEVDRRLARVEREAVADAPPTPYALEVVRAAGAAGLRTGIVSNNAGAAIERFLASHPVAGIDVVVGRPDAHPELMKPDPWPVREAARLLGVPAAECVLVGDSPSDVAAGRAAGTSVVGYAATASERSTLAESGADVVVASMRALADAV